MALLDPGNILAILTASTALGLGVWDRVHARRAGDSTAEATFREDYLARLRELEQHSRDLADREIVLRGQLISAQGELMAYKLCSSELCPYKARIIVK